MLNFEDYLKKVDLNVTSMLTPRVSDTYGRTRASSSKHRTGTKFVVLHTTANNASARNEALNLTNNDGTNSFHAVADKDGVYETVAFANVAHHAGNKAANCESLGFELVDADQELGYPNYVKYVAYAMAQIGLRPSAETVKWHNEFVNTSCGKFLINKGKSQVIADLIHYYDIAVSGEGDVEPTPAPKPEPTPAPKPEPTPQPSGWTEVEETGYRFYPNTALAMRKEPSEKSPEIKTAFKGDYIDYDRYAVNEGFVWIRSVLSGLWLKWRVNGGEKYGHIDDMDALVSGASDERYINLKPLVNYPTYGFYYPGDVPVAKNIRGQLGVYKNGGISYLIVGNAEPGVYFVNTRDYGRVKVFLDESRASITSSPIYKN